MATTYIFKIIRQVFIKIVYFLSRIYSTKYNVATYDGNIAGDFF